MRYEDPDAPAVAFVAGLGAAFLIVLIVLLKALFYFSAGREEARKTLVVAPAELARLRDTHLHQLEGYRLLDPAAGVAAIPIERAMADVVRESAAAH
jgi:hypothetical protein